MRKFFRFLASDFFISYIPTSIFSFKKNTGAGFLGTLVAVPFMFILPVNIAYYIFFLMVFTLAAIWICDKAKYQNVDDPKIIIDETAGYFYAMAFLPRTWPYLLAAFVIFRILDTIKPGFIKKFDEMKSPSGVVFDDIASGIVTCALIHASVFVFKYFNLFGF
ncbi:phosphatidylglycerophosphatase A family protein [Parelusimicrobium proximum]|uniref:phosphatidylglycerophosphatase A family protein n=1 Tax=Parelusimicrobium proximum TaxID=3228953 RepID=UPI003D173704